jgi:hypothetical protein
MKIKKTEVARARIYCTKEERELALQWLAEHDYGCTVDEPRLVRGGLMKVGDCWVVIGERKL